MPLLRLFIICLTAFSPLKAFAQDQTPVQLLQTVQSSLVEIRAVASKTMTAPDGHTIVGNYHAQGSGVILDSYGTIVTNTHIIANAQHIYVGLSNGTILEAKRVYSSDADFSFIKIDPQNPVDAITWADPSEAQVGAAVIALSYIGDQQHVLGGAITNLMYGQDSNNVELLQLNIALVPGDSGGPILDSQGHLLGIVMARKKDQDNNSYAISSNKIQQEYQQYQQNLPN